jgi:hypothetical protein
MVLRNERVKNERGFRLYSGSIGKRQRKMKRIVDRVHGARDKTIACQVGSKYE